MSVDVATLRKVGPEFAADLAHLWARTFAEAYADEHAPEDIDAYGAQHFTEANAAAVLSTPNARCVTAIRNDKPVGFNLIHHTDPPHSLDGPASELKQIYVIADEFGAGTGHLLIDDAMDAIKAAGRDWVWLLVSDKNLRALAFYAKYDFTRIGTGETIYVGRDTLPSSILARQI